ncbi:MAG: type I restriction endonuclease subunit R [Nitrospirae bacterium]|nr:type I restriction endonuclease subunit R [Nitrospirota bacterium]
MITDINSEDRLVQETFANYLRDRLGWESIYAYNNETFGPNSTLGRASERETVLVRDLHAALVRLNRSLPAEAIDKAAQTLIRFDFSRSMLQHNLDFYRYIRDGVPVSYRDEQGQLRHAHARVIDFRNETDIDGIPNNRFLAVRELKIQGLRVPHYNRRADIVCFINGFPVVFLELKAVYKNIRLGFDGNLTDYMTEQVVPHAFYHNAFLVVSNGDRARYGSITSKWDHFAEWKRNDEHDKGTLEARALLHGMLAKERLLDIIENFILFDDSKPGGTRKIVARNHQVLGVNNAVESVVHQEDLKIQFPQTERFIQYEYKTELLDAAEDSLAPVTNIESVPLIKRAHPDLGRLGVFWHTQGSGKSYSMAFFAEKVRRRVPGNFTFVIMTDREDLDDQIYKSFVGCGIADAKTTPRAGSAKILETLLKENHRFIFTLIQKFRREEPPKEPYSLRDDIIVISDEAHRTQAGKLARNMRLALPHASFIGFTGTPLFKYDQLTKRIFGSYVSRYDFKRSEEDRSTVKLIYENRGEKLGIARLDLNDRIATKIEEAELEADQITLLEKLLGKDYEVITADERLDKVADDFVEYCSVHWESGKSMIVCIDKVTCARMHQRIVPRWQARISQLRAELPGREAALANAGDDEKETRQKEFDKLKGRIAWMESSLIAIIISEAQNEVKEFAKWDFDIVPHRDLIKRGFETPDGRRIDVETAFKEPEHPFRIAIVCAMWMTGFDVECLSTMYIDKPMKAHTLMQAIARPNRVYPGKDCGLIVDYNGMLKSLREALAQYAVGNGGEEDGNEIVAPIEELVKALVQSIEAAENHLRNLGFEPGRLIGARGFDRIQAFRDAVEALYTSDESKRRYEIIARQVFERFKALLMEPSVFQFAERHDNIEAIYKKLEERRDTADITEVLKELHRIVNEAIRTTGDGGDQTEGMTIDLSRIDFAKLRDEFAKKVRRKHSALKDIRDIIEKKLQQMLANNPHRMDYYKKYQEIIAEYNREKDRTTVEETFARLTELANSLDAEQRRAVEEGLTENELALFDLLCKENISKKDRESLKQASRGLLASLRELVKPIESWTEKAQTTALVETFILDRLYETLPQPPYTPEDADAAAKLVYEYIWQRSAVGQPLWADKAA